MYGVSFWNQIQTVAGSAGRGAGRLRASSTHSGYRPAVFLANWDGWPPRQRGEQETKDFSLAMDCFNDSKLV